jgi:hypothetical protein
MTREASCTCGQLRVRCAGEPVRVSVCHCLACQRRTGSAFGVQARYRREDVSVEGAATAFTRVADSGQPVTTHFCPTCGSTVWYELAALPGFVGVPVGGFADPGFPAPRVVVYRIRAHPWADVPAGDDVERWD